jgi:hypothetical protein
VFLFDVDNTLLAIKKIWKTRVTTVFVRQGHYALDAGILARNPNADISVDGIGDLLRCELGAFEPSEKTSPRRSAKTHHESQ